MELPQSFMQPYKRACYPPVEEMEKDPPHPPRDVLQRIGAAHKLAFLECWREPTKHTHGEFDVFDVQSGQRLLSVKEEDSGVGCFWCCKPSHELKLNIFDPHTNQQLMVVDRPFKCGTQCPAWLGFCQQEATLMSGSNPEATQSAIGMTRQPCCGGIFTPTVNVMQGGNPDAEPFATVEGPMCCFGRVTEMCCDQEFPISSGSGGGDGNVGVIVKEKPEDASQAMRAVTDSDLFTLTFKDPSLDENQKLALLSTVLLLHYMFLENQPCYCNCSKWCSIGFSWSLACCTLHLCGCLQQCKCACRCGCEEMDCGVVCCNTPCCCSLEMLIDTYNYCIRPCRCASDAFRGCSCGCCCGGDCDCDD